MGGNLGKEEVGEEVVGDFGGCLKGREKQQNP